jgi:iron complex outermembrane recepter protein
MRAFARPEHLCWKVLTGAALGTASILGVAAQQAAQPSAEPAVPTQASSGPSAKAVPLPEIKVTTSKRAPARPARAQGQPAAMSSDASTPGTPTSTPVQGIGANGPPLSQVATLGKTGTRLEELPASVVVVPATTIKERGGTSLTDAVTAGVSGVNVGGSSTYSFFDRYLIRGMDARIYTDGFSDGDQFNGYPHSLNAVQQIEVLKGPGSALFGSTTPGGSINIVHFLPSPVAGYGAGLQVGSFGTISSTIYATGPTNVEGLNYRIDGLAQHSDGFRHLENTDYELRPAFTWSWNDHVTTAALDFRHIVQTPDLYGIPYVGGVPLGVPRDFGYSTPFGHGDQDIERITLTDAWSWSNELTINNRFSYMHRDLDILRNSGGAISGDEMTSRQLREQTDHDDDLIYQFEPVWKFYTFSMKHTLVTGLSAEESLIRDNRATADLPNIANIYAPIIPETSIAGLNFLRDSTHSGMVDNLQATFLGAYLIDQIDVTDKLKVRLSARQDWWQEQLAPQAFVAGRNAEDGLPLEPGMIQTRTDTPFSWSAGALYKILPGVSPFVGVSKSFLTNYNSEATQNGLVDPESAIQYEAGVKLAALDDRITVTGAAFHVQRNNVFAETNAVVNGVTQTTVFFDAQRDVGMDMDVVIKLTPTWQVMGNFISQEAIITAEPNVPAALGNKPIGVPNHIANAWMTYDFAIGKLDGFRIGGGMTYSDVSYANVQNTNRVPAYTVWSAVLSYNQPTWDASIGVKNIFNVTYFPTALSAGGYVGQPRFFFFQAKYHL